MQETLYSIGNCPFCRDGDVIIVKDTRTDIYFVVCDECQRVWNNPGEAIACAPSIDFINELRYLSWTVTEEELDESGWRSNVTHYL
jgi:hypothetical protein